jgi:hypothetical protein
MSEREMTEEEHRQRHVQLHRAMDELFADYIDCHPEQQGYLEMPVRRLLEWSHLQTVRADMPPRLTGRRTR